MDHSKTGLILPPPPSDVSGKKVVIQSPHASYERSTLDAYSPNFGGPFSYSTNSQDGGAQDDQSVWMCSQGGRQGVKKPHSRSHTPNASNELGLLTNPLWPVHRKRVTLKPQPFHPSSFFKLFFNQKSERLACHWFCYFWQCPERYVNDVPGRQMHRINWVSVRIPCVRETCDRETALFVTALPWRTWKVRQGRAWTRKANASN
jgi:hypothetical protein